MGEDVQQRVSAGNVKDLNDKEIVQIAVGGQHTLAVSADGVVYSWGCNDNKALGRGGDECEPCEIDLNQDKAVQVVATDSASLVLCESGNLYGWGLFRGPSGKLGFATVEKEQERPLRIELNKYKPVLIGGGQNHCFAVDEAGWVWAWGNNDEGQLMHRTSARHESRNLVPYKIDPSRNAAFKGIKKIVGGAFHTVFVNNKGELFASGLNAAGQLGDGSTGDHLAPVRITQCRETVGGELSDLPPIVDIACGESHTLVLSEEGKVYAHGANTPCQLGFETQDNARFEPTPTCIAGLDNVVSISANTRYSSAVTRNGELKTWGTGLNYELGNQEAEDEKEPYTVKLKGRKCIHSGCGGQFLVFLLEPKIREPKAEAAEEKEEDTSASQALELDMKKMAMNSKPPSPEK